MIVAVPDLALFADAHNASVNYTQDRREVRKTLGAVQGMGELRTKKKEKYVGQSCLPDAGQPELARK